jgi:hypothetical protein
MGQEELASLSLTAPSVPILLHVLKLTAEQLANLAQVVDLRPQGRLSSRVRPFQVRCVLFHFKHVPRSFQAETRGAALPGLNRHSSVPI